MYSLPRPFEMAEKPKSPGDSPAPPSKIGAPGSPSDEETHEISTAAMKPAPTATTAIRTSSTTTVATVTTPTTSTPGPLSVVTTAAISLPKATSSPKPLPIHIPKSQDARCMLTPSTPDAYRKFVQYLMEGKFAFHTYQIKSERAYRVVLRGLHQHNPLHEITRNIEERGHKCVLRSPTKRVTWSSAPGVNSSVTPKATAIAPLAVYIMPGNTTTKCLKSRETPATCALCSRDHPDNYRGCQIYKDLQNAARNKKKRTLKKRGLWSPLRRVCQWWLQARAVQSLLQRGWKDFPGCRGSTFRATRITSEHYFPGCPGTPPQVSANKFPSSTGYGSQLFTGKVQECEGFVKTFRCLSKD
ncbi:hypothetical protein AAG570_012531 [Ranatra chinensis]|uniref:Uncharacterized protein n=1 Tax=Ranatra chinensis TaxID=642074 RepID=A0ABD0YE43_9HEMI